MTITDGTRKTVIPNRQLENAGDLFYSGNHTGAQIGFYWDEEMGTEYIIDLYFGAYYGNDDDYDFEFIEYPNLHNKTPFKPNFVTLSKSDYDEFLDWYDMCNAEEFTYHNELFN